MSINTAVPEEHRQPTRTGAKEKVRTFDQTFLDPAAEIVHRDYIAHALRWGWAKKNFIVHEQTNVLDVGCGPDRPLMLVLFGGIGPNPLAKRYVGVDMNKIKPTRHARTTLYPEYNFIENHKKLKKAEGEFELITNFEVIEHMPKELGLELLKAMKFMLAPGGKILMSTPVYDGKARAKNHIHEYTIAELQEQVTKAGLKTVQRFGTFMNSNEVKKCCDETEKEVYNRLKTWYGNEILSCLLAPLHPDNSRNNAWVLEKK